MKKAIKNKNYQKPFALSEKCNYEKKNNNYNIARKKFTTVR